MVALVVEAVEVVLLDLEDACASLHRGAQRFECMASGCRLSDPARVVYSFPRVSD